MLIFLALACTKAPNDTAVDDGTAPWTYGLERIDQSLRGMNYQRGIIHLHSTYSHDACDGDPQPGGQTNEPCLQDLRDALCATAMDFAYVTDHPTHAAWQDFEDLLLVRDQDQLVSVDGAVVANNMACADGSSVLLRTGIEDELMPVGLERPVADTAEERDALYNSSSAEAIAAMRAAGGVVLVNHTEGRELEELERMQRDGVRGVEAFNLHAMVDPGIREEDLDLDPWQWAQDIEPFTHPESTAEPDLLFLAFMQRQPPSMVAWDHLSSLREPGEGPTMGIAGSDAHQNVLPLELRDGERVDSYRRMIRWFSNWLLVEGEGPEAVDEALEAGRNLIVFEALGTPTGLDVHLIADDTLYELGQDTPPGTLHVGCPTLTRGSPKGTEEPELRVHVLKDGQAFAAGCGTHALRDPGVYRVEVEMVPYHLRPFLGDEPEVWLRSYPWILTAPLRVMTPG